MVNPARRVKIIRRPARRLGLSPIGRQGNPRKRRAEKPWKSPALGIASDLQHGRVSSTVQAPCQVKASLNAANLDQEPSAASGPCNILGRGYFCAPMEPSTRPPFIRKTRDSDDFTYRAFKLYHDPAGALTVLGGARTMCPTLSRRLPTASTERHVSRGRR